MVADLMTYVDESDAPEDTLAESQVWALRQGVQAAIDLVTRVSHSRQEHSRLTDGIIGASASLSGSTTAA